MGFIASPFMSPFLFGFLVARERCVIVRHCIYISDGALCSWRWAYGVATIYGCVVLVVIAFFMEETYVCAAIKESAYSSSFQAV